MGSRQKSRFWLICRIYFRRFRITVWLCILAMVSALVYLNQIGLPNFVKNPLLEKLRSRGIDLQFSRLRLSYYRGIIAENVRFGQPDQPLSPQLTISEVHVQLNRRALAKLQFQVDSLSLRKGRLVLPVAETNNTNRQIRIEDIQTNLRFLPNDEWALDNFRANFAGAKILLMGTVTHASAVREWKLFQPRERASAGRGQSRLREFADVMERIHFSSAPELKVDIRGDARDIQSFSLRLMASTQDASTPWGTVTAGRLTARLFPAASNELSHASIILEATDAQTRWADTTNFLLNIHFTSAEGQTNLASADVNLRAAHASTRWGAASDLLLKVRLDSVQGQTNLAKGDLRLTAGYLESKWASATNAHFNGQWVHSLTNPIPISGKIQLECDGASARWGTAKGIQFFAALSPAPANAFAAAEPSWAWWTNLAPYELKWEGRLNEVQSSNGLAKGFISSGSWCAPTLLVTNLQADLYDGRLDAHASLNIATRAVRATLASDLDLHQAEGFLTAGAQRWLSQFTWEKSPEVKADMALVLPAWTNRQPDWRAEVQPTLALNGGFKIDKNASYRGVPVSTAQSHFIYSNMCWHLPDLHATRPEGAIRATHHANDRTKDYSWRISSSIDPKILRAVLGTNELRGLELVSFTHPPVVEAEIQGRFHDPERISFKGHVAITNFSFRGESFSGVQTQIEYTNRLLRLTEPRAQRGVEQLTAEGLTVDFTAGSIYVTNGFSTAEPLAIARAIGPHIGKVIEPYRFSKPPTVHVTGTIPMHGEEGADLRFVVDGGPFSWYRFNVPHVAGDIHWAGLRLMLTNVRADFYGGKATGYAEFLFDRGQPGTEYHFAMTTTNSLLQPLVADCFSRTNELEGLLNGSLVITKANSEDWRTANGYGSLDLHDGLIWDIPIFGIFSPVLNGIAPGLGNNRASAGTCTFAMTNGVVHSDDLEIRSPAFRLDYRGRLDLEGQVNARVEAEFLRDMWVVGPLVSTVLWPVTKVFEYKVTGSINQPKTEPVFLIPKLVLLPFHPFRTLKSLLPEDANSSSYAPLPDNKP